MKRRGGRGAGSGSAFGRRIFTGRRCSFGCGCLTTLSSGTICAPVPLVSVSRTQTLPLHIASKKMPQSEFARIQRVSDLQIVIVALFVSAAGLNALANWLEVPYPIPLVSAGW